MGQPNREQKNNSMIDDVCQDVNAYNERVIATKMGELEERLSRQMSGYATEKCVKAESDALKELLIGVETRFGEEHAALVEATNELKAMTKAQASLLEALCGDVKTVSEKVDALCSHTGQPANVEGDVAAKASNVLTVEKKADVVSPDVSSLQKPVDDVRRVFNDKTDEARKAEEERRLAELKAQEERRKAEEAARQNEEKEREEKRRKVAAVLRPSFFWKELDAMVDGVIALKEWTGKASATIVYDSKKDEFTHNGIFVKVKGKPNIAVVGFTTYGDIFGGFYSRAVTEQDKDFFDTNIFAFSFEAHWRCATPQRFVLKEERKERAYGERFVDFFKNRVEGFVWFVFGAGWFWLGDEVSHSYCKVFSDAFEGLEDTTLTGKTGDSNGPYHCTRIVSIQLS